MVGLHFWSCENVESPLHWWESLCDIVAYVLDCDIIVSEFELQSCYYIHFWTNTFGKRHERFYPFIYELNNTAIVLLQG